MTEELAEEIYLFTGQTDGKTFSDNHRCFAISTSLSKALGSHDNGDDVERQKVQVQNSC